MAVKKPRTQPVKILTATSIPQLSDGYVGRIIDQAISDVYKDIESRGVRDRLPRKMNLEIVFTPGENGRVSVDSQVKTKLPAYRPEPTITRIDAESGGLFFSPDCAENPDQLTINPDDEGAEVGE